MDLPKTIKVFDVVYKIEYVEKPSDVDIFKRETLWGQVDYWTRTIRIYKNDRQINDVWQTLWHEVLHAVCEKMDLEKHETGKLSADEHLIDLLATAINCIIYDNGLMKE